MYPQTVTQQKNKFKIVQCMLKPFTDKIMIQSKNDLYPGILE